MADPEPLAGVPDGTSDDAGPAGEPPAVDAVAAVLARSERRFQALIEHSADGIQLVAADGKRLYVSPSFGRMLGYSSDEVLQLKLWEVNEPADRLQAEAAFQELLQRPGESTVLRLRARHRDGSLRWLENTLTNLLDEPSVGAVVLNVRDVTAFEQSQEQMRSSREQFEVMLRTFSDGILMQTQAGDVLYANDAAARLCGFATAAELLAQPVGEILSRFDLVDEQGEPFPLDQLPARHVFAGERQAEATIGFRPKDGGETRWSAVSATVLDAWRMRLRLAVSVFRDITAAHQLQEAQRQAIAVRDRFLSTASHELRTPLTSLKAHLQLALRFAQRGSPPETIAAGLEPALRATDRLDRLIHDLLDVSRLTGGDVPVRMEPLQLGEMVSAIVTEEQGIEPVHDLTFTATADDLWVLADHLRLEQVAVNLLSNARKYSPPGSCIGVSLDGDESTVRLAVRDEGIGIPPEEQERIFSPFQRGSNVNESVSGLGLGLAIARELVEAHGGSLTLDSAPGRGSTFTVSLPRIPAPEAEPAGG